MAFVELERAGDEFNKVMVSAIKHNERLVINTVTKMPDRFQTRSLNFYFKVLKVRSGHLRGSIRGFLRKISRTEFVIGMRAGGEKAAYAPIQHEGGFIPPHIIRPRVKKALAWGPIISGNKRQFVAKSVRHPGSYIKPKKYMEFPMLKETQLITKEFTEQMGFGK